MKTRSLCFDALVMSAALVLCACPAGDGDGDGEGDADKEDFACELGILDADAVFLPAGGDTRAELELGFQGFLFVEIFVRAEGDVPARVEASSRVTVEGEDPTGEKTPDVEMAAWDSGYLSDPVLLFFNSETPADLDGKTVEVVVKLENDSHACTATGAFLLVDDDPCIHTGEEPICPGEPDRRGKGGIR